MIRIMLENLLLFLTPALIYFAYIYMTRDPKPSNGAGSPVPDGAEPSIFDGAPYIWLFLAGALLVLFAMVTFATSSGGKPGQQYVPPVIKDGKIIPGRFE